MGPRPKWPMSAYKASQPVMQSTTEPSTTMPCSRLTAKKFTAYRGSRAARIPGNRIICDQAQQGQGRNQKDHDGAKNSADALRSLALDQKEAQQDATGKRQDKGLGCGGGHIQALHGGEHGDDRRNQAFTA